MEKDEEHKGSRTRCTSTSITMRRRQEYPSGSVSAVSMQRLGCEGESRRVALRSAGGQSHKCWHYLRMIPILFHEGLAGSSVSVLGRDWTGQGSRRLVDVKD